MRRSFQGRRDFFRHIAGRKVGRERERRREAERIRAAGLHLLTLINDVLDLSKIEAGGMTLLTESVAVEAAIESAAAIARPLMARNRNRFEVSDVPAACRVRADPTRLRQCLLNLLSNAAKFTSQGQVRLIVDVDGGMWRCAVEDSGPGISEAEQRLLFQSFVRIERTTHNQPGTGLGLALTQRMSRLMGGDVRVASTLGVGSTFTLTIPLATGPAPAR